MSTAVSSSPLAPPQNRPPALTPQLAWVSHPECRLHDMGPGHPEQAARLDAIEALRQQQPWAGDCLPLQAPLATAEALLRAHSPAHVRRVWEALEAAQAQGRPIALDADTVASPASLGAALRAAGGAIAATDAVLSGQAQRAFCATRPPGHHATSEQAMGFCFFNNVAVAARHALEVCGLARVAIIDFDVHHGNGTEDIVAGDERILMVSFFQHPLYPHRGLRALDPRHVHLPLAAGGTGAQMRAAVQAHWLPALDAFQPELIFISAGFDAHREDPLAQMALDESDYTWLTQQILAVARRHAQGRVVSCLEGGYALSALARSVMAHVGALLEG